MSTLKPWQFFLITIAGWINRHQQDVIDYLVAVKLLCDTCLYAV